MKRLFYLLLAAFVCSPLLAQNPVKLPSNKLIPQHQLELRQHLEEYQRKSQSQLQRAIPQFKVNNDDGTLFLRDSTVAYSGYDREYKTVYTYDEFGRVATEIRYRYLYEETDLKTEYKYDPSGNLAGSALYTGRNDNWELSYMNETVFDENGREVGFVNMSNDWGMKIEYFFDADGKEMGYLYYGLVDGEWSLQSKLEYTLNANGYVTGNTEYSLEDGEWVVVSKYEGTLDAKGRVIVGVRYLLIAGEWVGNSKYEYAYDDNGHQILSVNYVLQDGEWVGNSKYEFAYDDNGHQILSVDYVLQDGEWVGYYKYEWAYDDNDHEILYASYDWQDGEWVKFLKNECAYDEHGNQTYYARFEGLNGEWVLKYSDKSEYTYDANGNIISQIYSYDWPENSDWGGIDKYEYNYDENGNMTWCKSFAKTNDESWVLYRTEIHYYTIHQINGIKRVEAESHNASRKVMKDGKVLIMKDGRVYNVQGQKVEMK